MTTSDDGLSRAVSSPNPAISLAARNELLADALGTARRRVQELQARLEALTTAPLQIGSVQFVDADAEVCDVVVGGRPLRVHRDPEVDLGGVHPGDRVLLNDELVVVAHLGAPGTGEIVPVKEVLEGGRVLVGGRGGNERVVALGGALEHHPPRPGETVVADLRADVAVALVERTDIEELVLEEIPDTDFSDIGGLGPQIEQIRDAVELPFRHPELYRDYGLRPPKGVLLYGPPGCGKTLIAKAVASSLTATTGARDEAGRPARSYFLNVKGPELLNKFVGETERQIRLMFAGAREKALAGRPVVIFFDEMEALFRTRGTGRSSDVETTVVPQLLAEIDGVEKLENVIVIGASNREDMIDPAILRPGRLDVKIRIERPDADGARKILGIYLTPDLPIHEAELEAHGGDAGAAVAAMIDATVRALYARDESTACLEATYADGQVETLYVGDLASGAMLAGIVDRAKKAAIKATLGTGEGGLRTAHLRSALDAEVRENEHLPAVADPDEWARVSGRRGERVVHLRALVPGERPAAATPAPRDVTTLDTGSLL